MPISFEPLNGTTWLDPERLPELLLLFTDCIQHEQRIVGRILVEGPSPVEPASWGLVKALYH